MEVGKVDHFRSKFFVISTMKIKFKKFDILTASSLGLYVTFHAKTKVISLPTKKYQFFSEASSKLSLSLGYQYS